MWARESALLTRSRQHQCCWPTGQTLSHGLQTPSPFGLGRQEARCFSTLPAVFLFIDGQNATCMEPAELSGWPITRVGNPLQYMCITHLDHQDYIFLLLIGFCIFAAGTVAAWLTGVCAVLYQNAHRKSGGDDTEDESGNRVTNQIFRSNSYFGPSRFPQLT